MVTLQRLHSGTGRYNLYLPLVKACLLPALSAMLAKSAFILSTRIFCRRDFKYFLSLSDLEMDTGLRNVNYIIQPELSRSAQTSKGLRLQRGTPSSQLFLGETLLFGSSS